MAKPLPDRIQHIVVVMLENRSFDNVLGGLYPELTRRGLYRGLIGNESNPLDPMNPSKGSVTVFQGPATSSTWIMPYPDPGELYTDMVQQIFGKYTTGACTSGGLTPMSGFAWNYSGQPWSPSGPGWPSVPPVPRDIMQYYSGATMPVSTYLAMQYAVCDGWFAAAPVQTIANRVMTHCGTPGLVPNSNPPRSRVDNPDFTAGLSIEHLDPTVFETTVFELLDLAYPNNTGPCDELDNLVNWKVYYHDAPLSALIGYVYDHWCDVLGGNVYNYQYPWDEISNFEYDIVNNQLPMYSFIEPRYTTMNPSSPGYVNSNHPGGTWFYLDDYNGAWQPPPANVMDGERLLCDIYSTLLRHPDTFQNTLLIVTYDEHGGLFDHVPPPCAVSPLTTKVSNFDYDRYGVRVPAILINPSISPGTVYPGLRTAEAGKSNTIDHTTIASTVMAQFNVGGSLSPRVDAAPTLSGLIPNEIINYNRPPLVCPPAPAMIPAPAPRRPMHPDLPKRSHTLAGALGPIYAEIQRRQRRRRTS
jgi:phospholipase C